VVVLKTCILCNAPIEDGQTLCEKCLHRTLEALEKEGGGLVHKLKGRAKSDLTELIQEICKHCPYFHKDISDPACSTCNYKEKEKLIRAFLE